MFSAALKLQKKKLGKYHFSPHVVIAAPNLIVILKIHRLRKSHRPEEIMVDLDKNTVDFRRF